MDVLGLRSSPKLGPPLLPVHPARMLEGNGACAVCREQSTQPDGMSKVVIEGRALTLCRDHAAAVVAVMPETFEDLRAIFAGAGVDLDGPGHTPERRSPLDRRAADDRRVFPPRPEGRRRGGGRRASDPR